MSRMYNEKDVKMMRIIDTATYFYGEGEWTAEDAMKRISNAYNNWK